MSVEREKRYNVIRPPETWAEKKTEILRVGMSLLEAYGEDRSTDDDIRRDMWWSDDRRHTRFEMMYAQPRNHSKISLLTIRCIDAMNGSSMPLHFFSRHVADDRCDDQCYFESEHGGYDAIEEQQDDGWVTDAYDFLLCAMNDAHASSCTTSLAQEEAASFDDIVLNTAVDMIDAMAKDNVVAPRDSLIDGWRATGTVKYRDLAIGTFVRLATRQCGNPAVDQVLGWRLDPHAVGEEVNRRWDA